VELVDTAGLREAGDEAERMGIAKSHEAMADADVVLLVIDAAAGGMSGEDRAVLERCESGGSAMLVAWNKWDLVGENEEADSSAALRNDKGKALRTSALTGEGIAELRAAVVAAVARGDAGGLREAGMLTNLRQHQAVEQALGGLDAAGTAVAAQIPHEMVLLDLYQALGGLDALTGATTTEDVLRLIFSQFCIGK
jgi:tRNA modification GTPase